MAKVMIVDDSETLRNSLLKLLTGAGLEVVEAADGAKGVALWGVHGQDVALIITDYNMPEMDGITMVKKSARCPKAQKLRSSCSRQSRHQI